MNGWMGCGEKKKGGHKWLMDVKFLMTWTQWAKRKGCAFFILAYSSEKICYDTENCLSTINYKNFSPFAAVNIILAFYQKKKMWEGKKFNQSPSVCLTPSFVINKMYRMCVGRI